jgi:hypothetical protein
MRHPERIDTGLFMEDFRDVTTFREDGNPDRRVFNRHRLAAAELGG